MASSTVTVHFEDHTPAAIEGLRAGVKLALSSVSITLQNNIKLEAPVDTGRLRANIQELSRTMDNVTVGTHVEYACVFDAKTSIVTDRGPRTIGQIQPGERVLTQTGDYKAVLAKSAFPAVEKPDLVTIAVPWRAGKDHELTVTDDHRILVHREGRNKWVPAGDIVGTDQLFVRRKLPHNIGAGTWKTCDNCGARHQRQGRKYCSVSCRNAAWAAGLNPHIGAKRSEETRRRQSEANRARMALRPETHPNRMLAQRGFRTNLERQTEEWLAQRGAPFESQVQMGVHYVDFWLPGRRQIVEADGAFWHQDQARDIARDREILAVQPDADILHLHFHDVRFSPIIDPNPLPNVHYVVCNPGPGSFADPEQFEGRQPTSIRHWRYAPSNRPHASTKASLYDLSVEGIHSFFANGILVSNSYVEFGTGIYHEPDPHAPWVIRAGRYRGATVKGARSKPFLRSGLMASRPELPSLVAEAIAAALRSALPQSR